LKVSPLKNFVCPIDGAVLKKTTRTLACEHGHVYDVAREGYCNLLLVQQKASLDPGDNKDMVAARRKFLDGEYFSPIAERVFKAIVTLQNDTRQETPFRIVDAGCGEGYYLQYISKLAANELKVNCELAGCDISKWAVKAAAKRSAEIAWAVASNRQLPFTPGTIDVILCLFGFPDWKSFQKVQRSKSHVITVDPGPNHLIELRTMIYPSINEASKPAKGNPDGYIVRTSDRFQFNFKLPDQSSIQSLLAMTPHAYRISQDARLAVESLHELTVSADIVVRVLEKV
jgi:23S rRNA (guanine745-N1)-methyltransferase